MKKKLLKISIILSFLALYSCEDKMKGCVRLKMDAGYSYDDAWDDCEEGRYDSQVR